MSSTLRANSAIKFDFPAPVEPTTAVCRLTSFDRSDVAAIPLEAAIFRQLREARLGRWQGSLDVPARSVVVCAGLGSERDDVLNELLVLALREAEIDARSVSVATPEERPEQDKAELVFAVFITYPLAASLDDWLAKVSELRQGLPKAQLLTIRKPFGEPLADQSIVEKHVDMLLRSHEEGVALIEPHRLAQSMRPLGQRLVPQGRRDRTC